MKEIKRPFHAQKALRVACLVLADLILINLSAFLALYIRFEFDFRQLYATTFLRDMLIYAGINSACTILIFHILKLYNSLWEFASVSELVRITLGCFFSAVFYMVGMFMLHLTVPRSFPAIYMLILCLLCGALRLSYRCVRRTRAGLRSEGEKRTMIFYEAPHKLLRTLSDLRDTFGVGLKACGYSINSTNPDEIKSAYEWLKALKPSVRVFDVTATKQAFISEEVVAGLAWNGDAFIAMQENPDLEFIVPEEGMLIWLDNFAIPAGAEHKENAYKFISYLMRPEVAKLCVEEFNYSTPNKAAEKILEPEYAESKVIVLDPEELAKGEVTVNVGKARELYEKYWEQLKAGD